MTQEQANWEWMDARVKMLEAYVADLEKGLESSLNLNKAQAERNTDNEPVAWMVDGVLFNSLGAALNISFDIKQPCIPLYTHPANHVTDSDYADAILQRDNYHAIADSLAEAIGVYFDVDIGEHSSGNNPWEFALGIIEDTHPAKTLTDEEIQKLHEETSFLGVIDPIKFARAILKKVSEK